MSLRMAFLPSSGFSPLSAHSAEPRTMGMSSPGNLSGGEGAKGAQHAETCVQVRCSMQGSKGSKVKAECLYRLC